MNDPLDQAFAAYLRACDEGGLSSREEFLGQYPDLANQLAELMQMADSLDQFVASAGESSSDAASPAGAKPRATNRGTNVQTSAEAAGASPAPPRPTHGPNGAGQSVPCSSAPADVNAETVQWAPPGEKDDEEKDEVLTLPVPRRRAGQCGPTLPYELGDYRLLEILGRGGMGVVYLAEQKGLGRRVAVKMIRSGILASDAEVRRFAMEAKAAAALEHRNIVSVYQSGYLDGHYYFSMEYVPGVDLAKLIQQAPLNPHTAARYVRDVARAIDHAHRRGVLHRDLKPANVLITPDDEVRVTDFGLAKQIDTDSSLTGSGAAIGTPNYMAPEQASGYSDRVQVQSDVYALGAVLFAAITGRAPFGGESVMQTLLQVIHQPAPPLRSLAAHAPEDLETITAKCLEKASEARYRTAAELADELDAFLDARPIKARPRPPLTRLWHWLQQVPLVAALLGHRVVEPSISHRRFQLIMLAFLVLFPLLLATGVSIRHHVSQWMPALVRIGGGLASGVYAQFSERFTKQLEARIKADGGSAKVEVVHSLGSSTNRQRLLDGEIHMAPMQAGAMGSNELCLIAPLFPEAVHVLVQNESPYDSVTQFDGQLAAVIGQPAAIDPNDSRLATDIVVELLGLEKQPFDTYEKLLETNADIPDIAIICVGRGSQAIKLMLEGTRPGGKPRRQWRLLAMPQPQITDLDLKSTTIKKEDYGLTEDIPTVSTMAFLVARWEIPDVLVKAALDTLYDGSLDDLQRDLHLASRRDAKGWVTGYRRQNFHPAAIKYFDSVPKQRRDELQAG